MFITSDYNSILTNLHRRGNAPHKPLLILTIMDGIERGYINSEKIFLSDELIDNFKSNGVIWTNQANILIAYPFYHMHSECFWHLVTKPDRKIPLTSKNSPTSLKGLRDALNYAEIDKELYFIFCDPIRREKLRLLIVETYFSSVFSSENSFDAYLKEMKNDILNCTGKQYKDKLEELEKKKAPTIYRIERIARNKQFEKIVKEIYNYTCCISHLHIDLENGISLVDACHIIPFCHPESSDTIGNGIVLAPTLHRAFDKGLITIDEEYKVVVSDLIEENESFLYGLKIFSGKKIKLPPVPEYYPSQENLCWHRDNIFRS